jgi:hypothetical protein
MENNYETLSRKHFELTQAIKKVRDYAHKSIDALLRGEEVKEWIEADTLRALGEREVKLKAEMVAAAPVTNELVGFEPTTVPEIDHTTNIVTFSKVVDEALRAAQKG